VKEDYAKAVLHNITISQFYNACTHLLDMISCWTQGFRQQRGAGSWNARLLMGWCRWYGLKMCEMAIIRKGKVQKVGRSQYLCLAVQD
jgi:hypothetical protein